MANQDIKLDGKVIVKGNNDTKNAGFYGGRTMKYPRNASGFIKQEVPFNLTEYIEDTAQPLINAAVPVKKTQNAFLTDSFTTIDNSLGQARQTVNQTVVEGEQYKLDWRVEGRIDGVGNNAISEINVDYGDGGGFQKINEVIVASGNAIGFATNNVTGFNILTVPAGTNGTMTIRIDFRTSSLGDRVYSTYSQVYLQQL